MNMLLVSGKGLLKY